MRVENRVESNHFSVVVFTNFCSRLRKMGTRKRREKRERRDRDREEDIQGKNGESVWEDKGNREEVDWEEVKGDIQGILREEGHYKKCKREVRRKLR